VAISMSTLGAAFAEALTAKGAPKN
jgi:hypothetical protein